MLTDDDSDDAGMSLIELIVAMGLAVVVMALSMNFFVGALQHSDAATTDSINTASARIALDSWSSLIRVADSAVSPGTSDGRIESISPTDLVFYANLGNRTGTDTVQAPTKVWLSMAGGELLERRFTADNPAADPVRTPYTYSTFPDAPAVDRILAGCATPSTSCATPGMVDSGAGFVAYYSATGCPSGSLSAAGLCTIDPASPATLDHAIAIGLSFTVTSANGRTTKGFTSLASMTAGAS